MNIEAAKLLQKIKTKKARIGVIGLGYVGLPLVKTFLQKGFHVTGFAVDVRKVDMLNRGKTYIRHISAAELKDFLGRKKFRATADFNQTDWGIERAVDGAGGPQGQLAGGFGTSCSSVGGERYCGYIQQTNASTAEGALVACLPTTGPDFAIIGTMKVKVRTNLAVPRMTMEAYGYFTNGPSIRAFVKCKGTLIRTSSANPGVPTCQ